jgi:hypothetical protein
MAFVPQDAFGSLPEDRQNVFWETLGVDYIPAGELAEVQQRYAIGFGFNAPDYDQMGINEDTVHEQREWFFRYMHLDWDSFEWADWRESMGYGEHD